MKSVIFLLQKTFVRSFYLRNAIFFGVIVFFFVLVVRPPTFFFSEDFVGILLSDWRATSLVLALATLYWLYAMWFLLAFPREPSQHFMHVLPALGQIRLSMAMALTVAGVLAPMLLYLACMVFHAVNLGEWTGIQVLVVGLGFWWGAVRMTVRRLMQPLARSAGGERFGQLYTLANSFNKTLRIYLRGMPLIYFGALWRRHRSAVIVTKLVSLLMIGLLIGAENYGDVAYALEGMAFLISGMLQGFVVYRLRETEELELSWFRNLPFPWFRRWLQWGATALLLNLPEIIVILLFTLRDGLWPGLLPMFVLTVAAYWWLCLGLSYLPQMRKQDFQILVFSYFMAIFIALLFQVHFALLFLPVIGLSMLIFARWN
jgi:hypothetical protein